MEAIILAGGFGTRLRPCIDNLPKPLAPIDSKAFLTYLLDYLYANGVHRAILSTGYMSEKVEQAIGRIYRGMVIDYSVEEYPLGTGGAIKKAISMCEDDFAVVINGDTFFDVNLFEMKKFHEKSGFKITLASKKVPCAERSGFISENNGILSGFCEKGISDAGYINGGIYFIDKSAFDCIEDEKFSFEKQVLEKAGFPIGVFKSDGYFIDIGIPEDYNRAQVEKNMLVSKRKRTAVFLDRDGTINYDTGHLYRTGDFRFLPDADKAIAIMKKKGYLVIIITNQAGIAKNLYTENDVVILHNHIDGILRDKYNVVADGYYYCPHHPDAVIEEYKKNCDCRKPRAGLILNAVADFKKIGIEIDISNSLTVGNRNSDILAGKNAGTKKNILIGFDEPESIRKATAHFDSIINFAYNSEQVL